MSATHVAANSKGTTHSSGREIDSPSVRPGPADAGQPPVVVNFVKNRRPPANALVLTPLGGTPVLRLLSANPWLVAVAEVALVSLVSILCISICVCTRKIRLA